MAAALTVPSFPKEINEEVDNIIVKESMDEICGALEEEILKSDVPAEEKQTMLARLRKLCNTETIIMLVRSTGCGKSLRFLLLLPNLHCQILRFLLLLYLPLHLLPRGSQPVPYVKTPLPLRKLPGQVSI